MSEVNTQSILRCQQCNKPFDQESALRRHGYYCRSKRNGTVSRVRSCASCAKGKVRCDNKRPRCSRCVTKAIDCQYPANTDRTARSIVQRSDDLFPTATASSVADPHNAANSEEMNDGGDMSLNSALFMPDLTFADFEAEPFQWDGPEIDLADFPNLQASGSTGQYLRPLPQSLAQHSIPVDGHPFQLQQVIPSPKVSLPRLPTYTTRSLIHRPRMQTAGQRSASLMLHTLVSYSRMMLRHKALPPFIHPSLISFDEGNDDMEPLHNCVSLVNMISSGSRGVRKLFWRNVQQECTRFCDEHLTYNKWELLATMQALAIYVLIRLDEGETDHNNFDLLLLTTVMVIAKQLNHSATAHDTRHDWLSDNSLKGSWKEWLFEESSRRICVIYQSLNLLVYFEPASMCDHPTDLILAPLPARKQLWQASDELTWAAAAEGEFKAQKVFALATNGELVKVNKDQTDCYDALVLPDAKAPSRMTADWGEWCSEMDDFGGLVMLAASLLP